MVSSATCVCRVFSRAACFQELQKHLPRRSRAKFTQHFPPWKLQLPSDEGIAPEHGILGCAYIACVTNANARCPCPLRLCAGSKCVAMSAGTKASCIMAICLRRSGSNCSESPGSSSIWVSGCFSALVISFFDNAIQIKARASLLRIQIFLGDGLRTSAKMNGFTFGSDTFSMQSGDV